MKQPRKEFLSDLCVGDIIKGKMARTGGLFNGNTTVFIEEQNIILGIGKVKNPTKIEDDFIIRIEGGEICFEGCNGSERIPDNIKVIAFSTPFTSLTPSK